MFRDKIRPPELLQLLSGHDACCGVISGHENAGVNLVLDELVLDAFAHSMP